MTETGTQPACSKLMSACPGMCVVNGTAGRAAVRARTHRPAPDGPDRAEPGRRDGSVLLRREQRLKNIQAATPVPIAAIVTVRRALAPGLAISERAAGGGLRMVVFDSRSASAHTW